MHIGGVVNDRKSPIISQYGATRINIIIEWENPEPRTRDQVWLTHIHNTAPATQPTRGPGLLQTRIMKYLAFVISIVPRPELELDQESHTEQVRDTAEQNMTTPHFYNIFHTGRGGGARAHGNVQNSRKTVKNITNILRCFLIYILFICKNRFLCKYAIKIYEI